MTKRNQVKLFGFFAAIWIIRVILAFIYREYTDSPVYFVVLIITTVLSIAVFIKLLISFRSDRDEDCQENRPEG